MPLFGKQEKDGVAKVNNVLGKFHEMQAELAEGKELIDDEIIDVRATINDLEFQKERLQQSRDEAEALEAGLRALTNGLEGV